MPSMRTIFEIGQKVFKLINVNAVTATIDGAVYRQKSPINSNLKNIVITTLPIQDGFGVQMQEGIFFINIFAPDFKNGQPDLTSLKAVSDAVITVIEAHTDTENFSIQILSQDVLNDQDHKLLSFLSLRCEYFIESGRSF